MAAILKMIVLVICLNTFLYLGTTYAMENTGFNQNNSARMNGDLFDLLLTSKSSLDTDFQTYSDSLVNGTKYSTGTSYNFSETREDGKGGLGTSPIKTPGGAGSETSGAFSFLDALNMGFAAIKTLFNIAIMPLTLMTNNDLPPLFAILIGFPLGILQLVTVIILIRGGGAT